MGSVTAEVLDVAAAAYHRDEVADEPSLSSSIVKLLINASPAHAKAAHPRLNKFYKREEDDKFSIGTAAHAMLLEGRDAVEVVEFDSWRTNDAKVAKRAAYAAGKIPLLGDDYFDVVAMVEAAKEQLDAHQARPPLFKDGKPERTITWEEDGVFCRARPDWLHDDLSACDDYKTSSRSARPESFARTLFGMGYDIQASFYRRGLHAVTGADIPFRFAVQETTPPYALSVVELGPDVYALADDKVDYAINLWRSCMATGEWHGYDTRVATAELPGWLETQWLERQAA